MEIPQKSRLESLQRIQAFADHNAAALGPVNNSRTRRALDAIVPVLERHAADQHNAAVEAKSRTEIKQELRHDLRVHHMQPIAAIAKARLNGVADTPLMAKLQLPSGKLDDKALVAAGHSMVDAAQQYVQVFVDEQLPSTFIDELLTATNALGKATADRDNSQVRVRVATAGLEKQFGRARDIVHVLNALVVKQLKGQDELIAGWKSAKRVRQKTGATRGTGAVTPVTPISAAPSATGAPVTAAPPAPPVVVAGQEVSKAA